MSIFSTEKCTWNRWNYFLSPFGIEDIYPKEKGMMSSIKTASKEVGVMDFFLNVDFSFTLSDFLIRTEENTEQGILNLIAQVFALFGLSVSILGIIFAFTENYCLRQPPEVKASELLIKKIVEKYKYRKSLLVSKSNTGGSVFGEMEEVAAEDNLLDKMKESDEAIEESNEEEENEEDEEEKGENLKEEVEATPTDLKNADATLLKRDLEKIDGFQKSTLRFFEMLKHEMPRKMYRTPNKFISIYIYIYLFMIL